MSKAKQVIIKVAIASLLFGFIQFVQAASMVATLPDGREVILLDDQTWRYATDESASSPPVTDAGKEAAGASAAVAGSAAGEGSTVADSTVTAKASPGSVSGDLVVPNSGQVIGEYQRSGVVMVAQPASYQGGRLIVPVSLRNEGTDSVILVEVSTVLRNDQGEILKRDTQNVWTSIKRMPETYFRPGTEQEGEILTFRVPRMDHYFLETDISEVERW